jgi:osmotically-inducible protein OsmY
MKRNTDQPLGGLTLERASTLVAVSLALWVVAGCASRDQYTKAPVYNAPTTIEMTGTPSQSDLEINRQLYDLFMKDRSLTTQNSDVVFQVSNGVVTMRGYTPTRTEARRIVERIEQVPGVVRVVNEATLTWTPRS